jgi:hypothetical protein
MYCEMKKVNILHCAHAWCLSARRNDGGGGDGFRAGIAVASVMGVLILIGLATCGWVVCCGVSGSGGEADGSNEKDSEKGLCIMCCDSMAAWKANRQSLKDAKVSENTLLSSHDRHMESFVLTDTHNCCPLNTQIHAEEEREKELQRREEALKRKEQQTDNEFEKQKRLKAERERAKREQEEQRRQAVLNKAAKRSVEGLNSGGRKKKRKRLKNAVVKIEVVDGFRQQELEIAREGRQELLKAHRVTASSALPNMV